MAVILKPAIWDITRVTAHFSHFVHDQCTVAELYSTDNVKSVKPGSVTKKLPNSELSSLNYQLALAIVSSSCNFSLLSLKLGRGDLSQTVY